MGPHGGARVGAGRPRKKPAAAQTMAVPQQHPVDTQTQAVQTPLEYMLGVMNDPNVDASRRDRMAVAVAPYVHGRAADDRVGKKEQRQEAADRAAEKFAVPAGPKLIVNNR